MDLNIFRQRVVKAGWSYAYSLILIITCFQACNSNSSNAVLSAFTTSQIKSSYSPVPTHFTEILNSINSLMPTSRDYYIPTICAPAKFLPWPKMVKNIGMHRSSWQTMRVIQNAPNGPRVIFLGGGVGLDFSVSSAFPTCSLNSPMCTLTCSQIALYFISYSSPNIFPLESIQVGQY